MAQANGVKMRVLVVTMLHPTPLAPHQAGFMPGRLGALGAFAEVHAVLPYRTSPPACVFRRPPPETAAGHGYQYTRVAFGAWRGLGRDRRPAQIVQGIAPYIDGLHAAQPFDVVLGHFLFPDAVAAATLARRLKLPLVAVAHGSDVNIQAALPRRRAAIAAMLDQAAALITVSRPLQQRLLDLGLPAEQATILPCGYDPQRFAPRDRAAARAALNLAPATWLVYSGMLRRLKRVDVILEALTRLPDARLAIVGGGDEAPRLADLTRRLNLGRRVTLVGPQLHERIPLWLAAADAVVLASEHEGTPTVLTEAMALGTPVVATAVGGIPDLVGDLARLVTPGDSEALAAAIAATLASPPPAAKLQERVAHLAWPRIGAMEAEILHGVVS